MSTRRQRAMIHAVLLRAAAGDDIPPELVARAREASVPTKADEERLRRAAEKRERKNARRQEARL